MPLGTTTMAVLTAFAFAGAVSRADAKSGAAVAIAAEAVGAALQADGTRAVRLLRQLPENEFEGADRTFRSCMLRRFGSAAAEPDAGPDDAFARATLGAYRAYWRAVLLHPETRAEGETALFAALRTLLGREDLIDLDALEPALIERLAQSGYHALLGRTLPLRELMLWTRQETRPMRVVLPEGVHTTDVVFLDGFASLGWADYATCHRRGAGGWATDKALYAVVPRYPSVDGEEFRVSFLGHETQHFADMQTFRNLAPWELEYRAKLCELAQARTTRAKVLRKFTEDQGDDPGSPHAYANRRVLAAVRQRLALPRNASLDAAPVARLQAAAVDALRADTRRRAGTQ